MANITEVSQWENVIRQIENGEAATGGADGLANIQAKQLANRTKWLKENYLPLTGGKVKKGSNGAFDIVTDDSTIIRIIAGSDRGAGRNPGVYLFSKDSNDANKGIFNISAGNGEVGHNLMGYPDGRLKWGSNDLAGSAIVAKSFGENGYVKYVSGLIIQWGEVHINPYDGLKIYTNFRFPISFTSKPKMVLGKGWPQSMKPCSLEAEPDISEFKLNVWNFTNSEFDNGVVSWIAIGV